MDITPASPHDMRSRLFRGCLLGALAFASTLLVAEPAFTSEPIAFPDEELAAESVLPVFDLPLSVRNRLVTFANRFEFGVGGTYSMLEPFFSPWSLALNGTYQWNEDMGINIYGSFNMPGVSSYTDQLNPIPGTSRNANLQFTPGPKYSILANYQYSAFYGKLSLTKDFVMRISLYGLAGLGALGLGDSVKPVATIGMGQRFFLSNSLALRFDLRFLFYSGPDVLKLDLSQRTAPVPSSEFPERFSTSTLLGVSLTYLLPRF